MNPTKSEICPINVRGDVSPPRNCVLDCGLGRLGVGEKPVGYKKKVLYLTCILVYVSGWGVFSFSPAVFTSLPFFKHGT